MTCRGRHRGRRRGHGGIGTRRDSTPVGRFGDANAGDDEARINIQKETFVNDASVTLTAILARKNIV